VISTGIAAMVGALIGGSKYQISTVALAVCVPTLEMMSKYQYKGLLTMATFAAVILVVFGVLRISDTLKHVAQSFLAALGTHVALLIATSQLQHIIGVGIPQADIGLLRSIGTLCASLGDIEVNTLITALAYIVPLATVKMFVRGAAPYFIYLVIGAAVTYAIDAGIVPGIVEIKTVGRELVDTGMYESIVTIAKILPPQTVLTNALTYAFVVALVIGTQTSFATGVASSITGDDRIQHNAELIATGIANFASVACGGLPVAPDVTSSLTNISFRVTTIAPALVIAAVSIGYVMYSNDILRYVPIYCIPSILIVYSLSELVGKKLIQYMNMRTKESCIFWITLVIAVYFGFIPAVVVGFTVSNMLFSKRMVNIKDATVQSVKNHDAYVDEFMSNKNGHSNTLALPRGALDRIEVVQITNSLLLNIVEVMEEALSKKGKYPSIIILYFKNVPYLDGDGLVMLKRLATKTAKAGGTFIVSGTNGILLDIVQQKADETGSGDVYGYIMPNFKIAVQQAVKRLGTGKIL
jgi:SulP family sulfate permease